jgi:hypothetical protein
LSGVQQEDDRPAGVGGRHWACAVMRGKRAIVARSPGMGKTRRLLLQRLWRVRVRQAKEKAQPGERLRL